MIDLFSWENHPESHLAAGSGSVISLLFSGFSLGGLLQSFLCGLLLYMVTNLIRYAINKWK
jgi:hypothetical protein